jgi:hypothetical protein
VSESRILATLIHLMTPFSPTITPFWHPMPGRHQVDLRGITGFGHTMSPKQAGNVGESPFYMIKMRPLGPLYVIKKWEPGTHFHEQKQLLTHIDMAAARTRILDLQETVALLEQTVGVLVMKNTAPTAPWEQ